MEQTLTTLATKHVKDIIYRSIEHKSPEKALIIYDTHYGLTKILTEAYRAALPDARFIDFDALTKEEVIAACDEMQPSDLVVLIQSSNFLLDAFRIRLHLFQKKLKVIEHTHLHRNTEDVWDVYVNALEYDIAWYRGIGPKLKAKLETANELRIEAGEAVLTVTGGVESPKLNIGDYAGMENIGGTFPIGEVFTESKDFAQMNGAFMIYAYAGADFCINMHEPFRVEVREGQITGIAADAPESFIKIVDLIKEYERPLIREIGFGLNRAITRERYLQDITAFERILGMHLSLGEKHSVYKKTGIPTHKTKFHVDLFPLVDRVFVDGEMIFAGGKYLLQD
jgi:leucyl aminopeptidase (aminopeptidase T)